MLFTRALLVGTVLLFSACRTTPKAEPAEDVVEQYPDELKVEDLVVGTGEAAADGMKLTVEYTGTLTNGQVFDSSKGREPFVFRIGDKVIKGWNQGLLGMKAGGKRRLTIPPRLGYGSKTVGPIPANSFLIFEIELLAVAP
jgi:FKBP-type peptidyl-prolyl cis-trans isomerase